MVFSGLAIKICFQGSTSEGGRQRCPEQDFDDAQGLQTL